MCLHPGSISSTSLVPWRHTQCLHKDVPWHAAPLAALQHLLFSVALSAAPKCLTGLGLFSFLGGSGRGWGHGLGMLLLFHSLATPFLSFLSAPSLQAGSTGLTSTCMLMFPLPKQVSHPELCLPLIPHTRAEINPSAL